MVKSVVWPELNIHSDNPYKEVGKFFKFLYCQYVEKYRELLKIFIISINEKNYLVTGLCGRSIVENTATLRYYNINVWEK